MKKTGFNCFFIDSTEQACFFFKCSREQAISVFNKFVVEDSYLKQFFSGKIFHRPDIGKPKFNQQFIIKDFWDIETFLDEARIQLKSPDNLGMRRKKIEIILRKKQEESKEIFFRFNAETVSIDDRINKNNFKEVLIHFAIKIKSNADLGLLYNHLWENYQFLRLTKKYSRYETLYRGEIIKVRHTWAQIERAIAIIMSINILLHNWNLRLVQQSEFQKLCQQYPFIREARKRFGFFKPSESETYEIMSSNKNQKEKLQLLNMKKEALLATIGVSAQA